MVGMESLEMAGVLFLDSEGLNIVLDDRTFHMNAHQVTTTNHLYKHLGIYARIELLGPTTSSRDNLVSIFLFIFESFYLPRHDSYQ